MDQVRLTAALGRVVIVVSPGLTILIGPGPFTGVAAPANAMAAVYDLGAPGAAATVSLSQGDVDEVLAREVGARLLLLVTPAVIARLQAETPSEGGRRHHLPSELRAIALALCDCEMVGDACDLYRSAKGVELLCQTFAMLQAGLLVPFAGGGGLSRADSLRILAARQLIDERWSEKLTLERIATLCGVNREKLTRGFREMFDCTIAEAIAERRLVEAGRMLLTTDLPVALVGYDNGYLNNASFTRAFGRRFGVTPSDYRAARLAA